MAKKKASNQEKKITEFKTTIQFELTALILLALAIIAIANLGAVGQVIVFILPLFYG